MLLLTLATYVMGKLNYSGVIAVLFSLTIVMVKGHFIIGDFMELKGVSFLWRAIMYGWLWTVCLAIAAAYIISI